MNDAEKMSGTPAAAVGGTVSTTADKKPRPKPIEFFVDEEKISTDDPTLTVRQILSLAGLDATTHYLIEVRGSNQIPHQNPDEELRVHEKQKFLSVFNGPTPVS